MNIFQKGGKQIAQKRIFAFIGWCSLDNCRNQYIAYWYFVLCTLYFALEFGYFIYRIFGVSVWDIWQIGTKAYKRILAYAEEKKQWFYFFDRKSFLIMAVMMSAGIYFRFCGYVPMEWIAVFYSGLGTALCMAGILFILQYQKQKMIQKEAIQNETIL